MLLGGVSFLLIRGVVMKKAMMMFGLSLVMPMVAQDAHSWNTGPEETYPVSRGESKVESGRRPEPRPAQRSTEALPQAPSLDAHFLQADEYLITLEPYKAGSGWRAVYIAKLVTPASAATKQEAEFFIINGNKTGEKVWTQHYCLTRPATSADLKLGAVAYALDGNREDDIYQGPGSREDNLHHAWFVGTINDDSNLYKGYLALSGYKVKPSSLRVRQ